MNEEWNRNANTINLLELTQISGVENVYLVVERAQSIFAPWLVPDDLDSLIRVISELCQNIYQHSNDPHGCLLIQKYHSEAQHNVSICLAVGDSGCGIHSSLIPRYNGLGDEPLDFIRAAMDGNFTSHHNNRGGPLPARDEKMTSGPASEKSYRPAHIDNCGEVRLLIRGIPEVP